MAALHPVKRNGKAKDIAKRWGVSVQTVRRYIAQPRTEYEAQSIERAKPWESLGISRATWFRRGKPEQWERYTRTQSGAGFEVSEA